VIPYLGPCPCPCLVAFATLDSFVGSDMPWDSENWSSQRRSAAAVKTEESPLGFGENGWTSWFARVKRVYLPAPVFSAKIVAM
jgi:hypothetical protein